MDARDLAYIIDAHSNKSGNRTRKWDMKTPYYVHPIWCAAMILHETSLPGDIRKDGSQALLYHDVLEDTTAGLAPWLSGRVRSLTMGMTFDSSEDEWENLWKRDKEVRLLKVYDKTSNLLDGIWMTPERREKHVTHLRRLVEDVEGNYGGLNILNVAKTLF